MRDTVELADLHKGDARAWRAVHDWVEQAAASFRPVLAEEWEDAVQEAEIRLLRMLRKKPLRDHSHLSSLTWRITRNVCIDQVRRRKVRSTRPLEDALEPRAGRLTSPTMAARRRELRSQVSQLLSVMSGECRQLLWKVEEGATYSELAWQLGVSPGALRVRVHRCRQQARKRFARMTTPIVAVAQRLFISRGYARTSVGSIADAAGVTVEEVENLFPDKAEIVWAMGHRILTGADGLTLDEVDFARPLRATDDPRERIRLATELTAQWMEKGFGDFENLVIEAARVDPRQRVYLRRMIALQVAIGRELVGNVVQGVRLPRERTVESMARPSSQIDSTRNYRRLKRERGWCPEEIRQWKQAKLEQLVLG